MAKDHKAGLMKPLLMIVLVFGPALFLILVSLNKCDHNFTILPNYGNVGDYSFQLSNGEKLTNKDLEGKVMILNIIQPSCPANCSINLSKFNLMIYQHYRKYQKKMSHIKFVSLVLDHKGNPIPLEKLDEVKFNFQDMFQEYDENIWMLVTGDPQQIYDIESNNVNLFRQEDKDAFGGRPFMETMMIVDKVNNLRLVRKGTEEGYIRDFKEHIALLQKQYDKEEYEASKKK